MGPLASGRSGMAVVARVEWRSEGRHAERPAALLLGGERVEVEVEERWVEGPASAGGPLVRCFLVRDASGRAFRVLAATGGASIVESIPRRGPVE